MPDVASIPQAVTITTRPWSQHNRM